MRGGRSPHPCCLSDDRDGRGVHGRARSHGGDGRIHNPNISDNSRNLDTDYNSTGDRCDIEPRGNVDGRAGHIGSAGRSARHFLESDCRIRL